MKKDIHTAKGTAVFLVLGLMAAMEAHAGAVGAAAKLVGKVAEHGADNVAEHVLTHQADDIAEAAGKGASKAFCKGGTQWAAKGGALEKAVDGAVMAARAERKGIGAKTILAVGAGVAGVDAAHNVSKGIRERHASLGEAEKGAIAKKPELVREIRADESRWKNILATGGAVAMLAVAVPFAWAACGFGRILGRGGYRLRRRLAGRAGGTQGKKKRALPEKREREGLSGAEATELEPIPEAEKA